MKKVKFKLRALAVNAASTPVTDGVNPKYFGDPNTEGTWRIRQTDDNQLAFERLIGGIWNIENIIG